MRNTKLLAAFFLFSVLTLLFASPDSYLYDLWLREDSAWFFVNGKAWMNGMEPYVDFADSKGPLLFLIYGIGYLLSPYNYLGIFWLSCIVYTICFFLTYKPARIFIDHRHALLDGQGLIGPVQGGHFQVQHQPHARRRQHEKHHDRQRQRPFQQ